MPGAGKRQTEDGFGLRGTRARSGYRDRAAQLRIAHINVGMISEGMLDILDRTAPYDIMIISEARQQHDVVGWALQKYGQDRFLCSLPHAVNPKSNRKKDQQGQVAIFQRYRAAVAMTDSGSDCQRTIWASYNIDTGSVPVFVYGAYIPVKSRGEASHPNQADTWAVLQERMALAPNRAARFLLMDANAELIENT